MKKNLITLLVLLSASGCQQSMYYDENNAADGESKKAVLFSGNVQTRMVNDGWEANDQIGVCMFESGALLSEESVINNSANRKYAYIESKNGFFPSTKNDTIYYPKTGEVDFIAYYPYKSVTDFSVSVDASNQSRPSAIDLLYSNNLTKVSRSDEVLKLNFRHCMSKLVFLVSVGEGLTEDDLKGLKLTVEDVVSKASFSLSSGTFALEESSGKSIDALADASGKQAEAIVLPQSCAGKLVRVTIKSQPKYTFKIVSTDKWEIGYKYTYNITLVKDDYSVAGLEAVVETWTDADASDLERSGSEVSVWDGTSSDTGWYAESETDFDIYTAGELAGLSELVRGGGKF